MEFGPLLKLLVDVDLGKIDRFLLADAEPGDAADGREIDDVVTVSSLDRLQKNSGRDFSRQGEQFAREPMPLRHAWRSQREVQIFAHACIDCSQPLLFQASLLAKSSGLKRRHRFSRRRKPLVLDAVGGQRVFRQALVTVLEKDFHAIGVLEQFDRLAFGSRNPIVVRAERHVAINIGAAKMRLVRSGQVFRQLVQVDTFVLEQLGRNQAGLTLRPLVHLFGGPLPSLRIQIFQTFERSTGKEVGFDRAKTSFVARFAIRMIDRVAEKLEAVTPSELGHLRNDDRRRTGASQASQIGVVDDADVRRVFPKHQRFVQKTFHLEAVERSIEFQILSLGITKINHTGDEPRSHAIQFHLINRRVVLHLSARFVGNAMATGRVRLSDAQFSQHPR